MASSSYSLSSFSSPQRPIIPSSQQVAHGSGGSFVRRSPPLLPAISLSTARASDMQIKTPRDHVHAIRRVMLTVPTIVEERCLFLFVATNYAASIYNANV